ncbi:hypothetical protein FALCPG4_015104 [Fusarium falciforme]
MRLINVLSKELEEFFGDKIPDYAILSHTWGDEEVSFQEWHNRHDPAVSSKKGYMKITSACHRAHDGGLSYLWVDTNCIDKTSSAELSEAINSMFAWYREAKICYAFLEDFDSTLEKSAFQDMFKSCRWFTRGWTLQELIAPETVIFYDQKWVEFGTKAKLSTEIAQITTISERFLSSSREIKQASAAQRMSWLARRRTTRIEDMAYCMLGIFNINIPLLYGEAEKAFTRLQEEIVRTTHDHTIFCWTWPETLPQPEWIPILAPNAAAFINSGSYVPTYQNRGYGEHSEYAVTNLGIRIRLPIARGNSGLSYYATLNVRRRDSDGNDVTSIPLRMPGQSLDLGPKLVWRANHPTAPIELPGFWAGAPQEVFLARPGVDPSEEAYVHYRPLVQRTMWPDKAPSTFAALPLQPIHPKIRPLIVANRATAGGLVFLHPTKSSRVWYGVFDIHCFIETVVSAYLVVQLAHTGPRWLMAANPIKTDGSAQMIDEQVANLENRIELRFPGVRESAISVKFGDARIELKGPTLGPLAGIVVRPLCFCDFRKDD